MQQILVYADSLSWGLIPDTRRRFPFDQRWPGVLENKLNGSSHTGRPARVIEDCLNGRRTVWEDPFKAGRNGLTGLAQRIEVNSPLALVILMLGSNDFQFSHPHNLAWSAAQGVATLVQAIRQAPIEPGMPVPPVLVVCPPRLSSPRGLLGPKFAGGEERSAGLAEAYRAMAASLDCPFFDAAGAISSSRVDGIHLDVDQHLVLGEALAGVVAPIIFAAPETDHA